MPGAARKFFWDSKGNGWEMDSGCGPKKSWWMAGWTPPLPPGDLKRSLLGRFLIFLALYAHRPPIIPSIITPLPSPNTAPLVVGGLFSNL